MGRGRLEPAGEANEGWLESDRCVQLALYSTYIRMKTSDRSATAGAVKKILQQELYGTGYVNDPPSVTNVLEKRLPTLAYYRTSFSFISSCI